LTKKLKECGVFGVSSGEYLDYATKNREEWALRGETIVATLTAEARAKYGVKGEDGSIVAPPEQALVVPDSAEC